MLSNLARWTQGSTAGDVDGPYIRQIVMQHGDMRATRSDQPFGGNTTTLVPIFTRS